MKTYFSTRQQIATFIALLFHTSGFIAIAFFHAQSFVDLTPLNLLVSCGLLIWTQEKRNGAFWLFAAASYGIGFVAELIGIHTHILFGNYRYGKVLGPQCWEVPLMIGITWFGITYCCGVAVSMLQQYWAGKKPAAPVAGKSNRLGSSVIFVAGAALLAVTYDWILEPVAIKLDFWQWEHNRIPAGNYWGWFGVSALVLLLFRILPFPKRNLFAIYLLLIQILFFLLLRTFY